MNDETLKQAMVCPRQACGAYDFEPCLDRSGRERKEWHSKRLRNLSTALADEVWRIIDD